MEQRADFVLDTKAVVHEEDGQLVIEGLAADNEEDRQDEAFEDGAFDHAIKSFLESNPALLYHHQFDKALGRVVDLQKRPDGLWMKAVVDPPAAGSWAEDVVNKIKRGTIKGLSVGGKFVRKMTPAGPRIHRADLMEISVTPMPVNPRTLFAVAGKAFQSYDDTVTHSRTESEIEDDLTALLDTVEATFDTALARLSQHGVTS